MCRSRRDDCLDAKEALLADKYRIVILVLAMLLGARRLPSLGRNFGQGIRVFTKGITGGAQDESGVGDALQTPPREPEPVVPARRWQTVGGLAGLVAALAYSSFPLADPLGSTLDPMNSYVSELGAPAQPAGAFFRTTDMVAGVLIVVLAVALRGSLPRDWRRDAGATALGLAGASSVFDGWHPIACAPSADPACRLREDTMGLLGQLREPHTVSSVAGVTAAIASMALLGHLLGSEPGSRRAFGVFGQVAASVVTGLSLAEIPLTTADPGVGLIERIHVLCISAWLVALALLLLRDVDGHEQAQRRARASG